MEKELRVYFSDGSFHCYPGADIADFMINERCEAKLLKQARLSRRIKSKTVDAGAEFNQPECQPRAFESGMTGEPNVAPTEAIVEHQATRVSTAPGRWTTTR